MKYALLPGGFKPPHAGHYESAKWLIDNTEAEYIIIKVGSGIRDGINQSMSVNLWNLYIVTDPDPNAKKIKVYPSEHPSPIKDAYEFVGELAPKGSFIYLGVGEKDTEDNRWDNISNIAKQAEVTAEIKVIPMQKGGISGTEVRQIIKDNNKEQYFQTLPIHLDNESKEAAWEELSTGMQQYKKEETFSVEWWKKQITENIILEGGAAGHMPHPFDIPGVTTGKKLIDVFEKTINSLNQNPGSLKIDGINVSLRVVNIDGNPQFVLDRGSGKELDVKGITKDDLVDRFGEGHGMIEIGSSVIDLFNEALPKIESELGELGFVDNPNLMLNMEYVSGKTNVKEYNGKFIVIHGINKIEPVPGKKSRISSETSYSIPAMNSLVSKTSSIAEKKGYKIYGSVPVELNKKPNLSSALNKKYTITFDNSNQTKTLNQWLNEVNKIPSSTTLIKVKDKSGNTKKVGALTKAVYISILEGANIDQYIVEENDKKKAIDAFVIYLATEVLGDEILKSADSSMGSVENHEGIVIKDPKISPVSFKITGKFIRDGLQSSFGG